MAFSLQQLSIANTIVRVGQSLGASSTQILSALEAAWTESRLGETDFGDNHSAYGVFQQRPVAGWGNPNDLENPEIAATKFFQGTDNNAGLLDVWNPNRSPGLNAQAVQHSAFPYRYDSARGIVSSLLFQQDVGPQQESLPEQSIQTKDREEISSIGSPGVATFTALFIAVVLGGFALSQMKGN